jgi:hypothetical protein
MLSPAKSAQAFVYYIRVPSVSRRIALAALTFFSFLFALGLALSLIGNEPLLGLILATFGGLIVLFLVLAYPSKNRQDRIEFTREGVRHVPGATLRWMGEPASEVPITPDIHEVLICQGSQDSYDTYGSFFLGTRPPKFPWGFRILIRSKDGNTRELEISTGDRLDLRQATALSDGIVAAIGVPVRFVKRELSETGTASEIAWTPAARRVDLGGCILKLVFVTTPFVGGITLGIIRPNGLTLVAIGVCLWLLQTLAVLLYAKITKQWSRIAALLWLTTAVSFAGAFAVMYFLSANFVQVR